MCDIYLFVYMNDNKIVTHKNEYGCLMAMVKPTYGPHIVKMNKTAIPSGILYIDDNDPTYGYDEEPHVTIKYGFVPDLTRRDLASILSDIKPFVVRLMGLSQFKNERYDVVKFDVECGEQLRLLRERCDGYANEDKYPEYKPHMTLAYVQKDKFPDIGKVLDINVPITRFKYSGRDGKSLYINL